MRGAWVRFPAVRARGVRASAFRTVGEHDATAVRALNLSRRFIRDTGNAGDAVWIGGALRGVPGFDIDGVPFGTVREPFVGVDELATEQADMPRHGVSFQESD